MESLRQELIKKYAGEGLTKETLKLSQNLDMHIAIEQRKLLEQYKNSR